MDEKSLQPESSKSPEGLSEEPNDTSIDEKLDATLDRVKRSEDNMQTSIDISDHSVVVSQALNIANVKLDKLRSKESPDQEELRKIQALINDLEEKQRELEAKREQAEEKERAVKKYLNTVEDLGSQLYQLHMMLAEREDKGINPLITTEPLKQITQSLLTATDGEMTMDSIQDIVNTAGRAASNIARRRQGGGPVRGDTQRLESILVAVRGATEEIDTLQKQIRDDIFEEDLQESAQRAFDEVKSAVEELEARVHKKMNMLEGY